MSGKLLGVLRSYLSGQKQFVQLGDVRSPSITVASGVPRGSLLGPLLFLVYVSKYQDLPNDLTNDPYMFADDTKLSSIHKKSDETKLQNDLDKLETWCAVNCMEFNVLHK